MSQYIQIISKLKPKNWQNNNKFYLLDITNLQVDLESAEKNLLFVKNSSLITSGISWQDELEYCNINGDLHINGSLFENSDEKLKTNVITISNAIQKLENINGVSFTWRQNGANDYGVIAQQLEKYLPQMVNQNTITGTKQVSYIKLIPFLIQAVKELNDKIQQLEKKKTLFNRFFNWIGRRQYVKWH